MTATPYRPRVMWTDTERAFLISTHTTLSAVEQAKALGRDYDCLCFQRQRLIKAGLIEPSARKYGPPYTDADRSRIVELVQAGYSVSRIGRALNRPYGSIVHEIAEMGGIKHLRSNPTARVWVPSELGTLFGLTKHTIDKWVRLGWIASTRNTAPRRGRVRTDRLITDEALLVFLAKRDYWPAWHPADITDPDWQEHARDLRRDGDWVASGMVARRYEIKPQRVWAWLREGRDEGIRALRYGMEWLVWSDDVAALVDQIRAYDWTRGAYKRRQAARV